MIERTLGLGLIKLVDLFGASAEAKEVTTSIPGSLGAEIADLNVGLFEIAACVHSDQREKGEAQGQ